jgi:cytochrome P450
MYSYLKELVPEINQCVDKFLDNLESSARTKSPVSLRDEFALLTLNVVSKVSGILERYAQLV